MNVLALIMLLTLAVKSLTKLVDAVTQLIEAVTRFKKVQKKNRSLAWRQKRFKKH